MIEWRFKNDYPKMKYSEAEIVKDILWLINSYIPMDRKIKRILNVVVVIGMILWLLSAFGVIGSLLSIRIGR